MITKLFDAMVAYYSGDARRIAHFVKVHGYARAIGLMEGLDEQTQFILEASALVHDIGIKVCEEKYQSTRGDLQEKEGPAIASKLLLDLGFTVPVVQRITYLVGHHHTYTDIIGADYRILVESDFLVNLHEDEADEKTIRTVYERIFKTESGKRLCREIFAL